MTTPKPPKHLSREAAAFWRLVNETYDLEPEAQLLLRTACESWDRSQQARALIAKQGLVLDGRRHPAISVERDAQSVFLRALRALNLDVIQPGPIGRPPGT